MRLSYRGPATVIRRELKEALLLLGETGSPPWYWQRLPPKSGAVMDPAAQNRRRYGRNDHRRVHGAGECRDPRRPGTTRNRHHATLAPRPAHAGDRYVDQRPGDPQPEAGLSGSPVVRKPAGPAPGDPGRRRCASNGARWSSDADPDRQ